MRDQNSNDLRSRCHFGITLRFELFFALHSLLSPEARIHLQWRQNTLAKLPPEFFDACRVLGGAAEIWSSLEGALPHTPPYFDYDQIIESLEHSDLRQLQRNILLSDIHLEEIVDSLLKGEITLHEAMGKMPKVKRDWLSFVGLYPYDPASPQVVAIELLLKDPVRFRQTIVAILKTFWQYSFRSTWDSIQMQLKDSMEEKERFLYSCSFSEFAQHALLRIRVDEAEKSIEAIRGGFKLHFDEIEACYFFPSAFNDRRYWSSYKVSKETSLVYFPYFDPGVRIDSQASPRIADVAEPELDPALIFKALGDSTRYAMVSLLARRTMSSVELAKALAVSKATISHHISQLREAGLISEKYEQGSVKVTLKRTVFEKLSALLIRKLFDEHNDSALVLNKTRRRSSTDVLG
jgi:DNA-binding transcriptional ArsR family regulator